MTGLGRTCVLILLYINLIHLPVLVLNRCRWASLRFLTIAYWIMTPALVLVMTIGQLVSLMLRQRPVQQLITASLPLEAPVIILTALSQQLQLSAQTSSDTPTSNTSTNETSSDPPPTSEPVYVPQVIAPVPENADTLSVMSIHSFVVWLRTQSYMTKLLIIANLSIGDRHFPVLWLCTIVITVTPALYVLCICLFCIA